MFDKSADDGVLLRVKNLVIVSEGPDGDVVIVDDVSFEVRLGEVLCIVGESGSGKSLTMLAVMGLLPAGLRVDSGSIELRGRDLLKLSENELRAVRGREIGMIFQDPMTSMNPLRRVGSQLAEAVRLHQRGLSRRDALARVYELLRSVGVPQPETRAKAFPHQWSGGMRQRAMIAMATANDPVLLIADEPTTALDVTIQSQVMDSLASTREKIGSAMVLITHDLGLAAENASRIAIMYSGRLVETGDVADVFRQPGHAYTKGLLASVLTGSRERAYAIPGSPPSPRDRPGGCAFAPRCPLAQGRTRCQEEVPVLRPLANGTLAACHFAEELLANESMLELSS
ncbi:ABC transporter ATP-binding protein [Arthrobacter sp. 35W]|uniref:ABC transporter ATP-binding protein n=1 Tax=Arthrobacter sp. 35W TaxID=1132441 RepID=UPI00040C17A1|nr:ABC transporter ATP-binding protein [Arthrobacter sp. 35W]